MQLATKESNDKNSLFKTNHSMHNFGPGPSILPKEVLEEAASSLVNFNETGLSIVEIGHRTRYFQEVMDEAIQTIKELMQLDQDHEVIFLHGGASTQFFQVPMNLLDQQALASYTDTGVWGAKAIKEAKLFGSVEIACSSRENNYNHLPKNFAVNPSAVYLHLTTNNTIYGTQWQDLSVFYNKNLPLVADMSSDILSRQIDFNKFDLIYAGAQKNIGAAGVNLVVIHKRCLGRVSRPLPSMMDYRNHIEAGSMLNTPPVFAVYLCLLTLRWLQKNGGVSEAEKRNKAKAELFYHTLDAIPLFKGTTVREDRSKMNACFMANDPGIEKEFLQICDKENIVGIKGHRSVGGFRASMYNALPYQSVKVLTDLMSYFAAKKG